MVNEKRLIDANALKDGLMKLEASGGHKYYRKGMDDTLHFHMPHIIDDAPTVDAVEVVRCKDCKYWSKEKDLGMFCNHWGSMLTETVEDDFCSYGERKDNDND